MALNIGERLGPYEILEPIGAGGMGEVYRAKDTKLGREVAIKVLPEAFAENEERLARFEREAKVLAQLNHPGIAHLYGLERSEGVDYLAMELVDGDTLAERIARGPIAVDEVPWCTTPIEAESSLGPDSHHPIISVSGIPSAVMVLRILHPILASTLCAANPLARIAEPTIAL